MMRLIIGLCLVFAFCALNAQAQDKNEDQGPDWRERAQDWRQRMQQRREQWRERMEQMANATPEEREERRTEGWVGMLTRAYELDEKQKDLVRNEIVKIRDEYRTSLGEDAEKMDRIREQMSKYWRERLADREGEQPGNPMEDPKFSKLRERIGELMREHPFNWRESVGRIEALLPPDQAAKGRERREQWMASQERFREMGAAWRDTQGMSPEERREAMRARLEAFRQRAQESGERGGDDEAGSDDGKRDVADLVRQWMGDRRGEQPGGGPGRGAPPSRHPWDVYTRQFVAEHKLDAAQTTAARSILKDCKERAGAVRRSQAEDREKARDIEDAKARVERVMELNEPIKDLFEELKTRLDALLTAKQIDSGSGEEPKG